MDEIAWRLALVTAPGRWRLQSGETVAMAEKGAGDGGFGEPGGAGDLEAREPSAAQSQDASDAEWVDGSGEHLGR